MKEPLPAPEHSLRHSHPLTGDVIVLEAVRQQFGSFVAAAILLLVLVVGTIAGDRRRARH